MKYFHWLVRLPAQASAAYSTSVVLLLPRILSSRVNQTQRPDWRTSAPGVPATEMRSSVAVASGVGENPATPPWLVPHSSSTAVFCPLLLVAGSDQPIWQSRKTTR
jgi:hypothetical protein